MFSFSSIITKLYVGRSTEEVDALVARCASVMVSEYDEKSWHEVNKEHISHEEVQLRLIRTLYESQFAYDGVVGEILYSLEEWSAETTLIFPDLPDEQNAFYSRYYAFLGFLHFAALPKSRQLFLLGSRLLLIACVWDVPLYHNVQEYFAQFLYVFPIKYDAALFAKVIANNKTMLGDEGKTQHTIGEWVKLFDEFPGNVVATRVDDFLNTHMEVSRLDAVQKEILSKILTLYFGLKGGFIWREIDYDLGGGHEFKGKREGKQIDDYYIELITEAEDITEWLSDWQEVVKWIVLTKKGSDFINRLFYALTQKVDLANEQQTSYLMELMNSLQQNGWSLGADLLYFNEKEGGFVWSQNVVEALRTEVKTIIAGKGSESVELITAQKPAGVLPSTLEEAQKINPIG